MKKIPNSANVFLRKIKIARLFKMNLNNITHKHWNLTGSYIKKTFTIPIKSV